MKENEETKDDKLNYLIITINQLLCLLTYQGPSREITSENEENIIKRHKYLNGKKF